MMQPKETGRKLKCASIAIVSMIAAITPGGAGALQAPLSSYHDRRFDVSMVRCVSQPVAVCTINVVAKVDSLWDVSGDNRLIDSDGDEFHAVSMSMGGTEYSIPSHYAQKLVAGVPAKIEIRFDRPVERANVRVLMIYVGHWSAKTIKLEPNWVS